MNHSSQHLLSQLERCLETFGARPNRAQRRQARYLARQAYKRRLLRPEVLIVRGVTPWPHVAWLAKQSGAWRDPDLTGYTPQTGGRPTMLQRFRAFFAGGLARMFSRRMPPRLPTGGVISSTGSGGRMPRETKAQIIAKLRRQRRRAR